jgi:acetyl esterase
MSSKMRTSRQQYSVTLNETGRTARLWLRAGAVVVVIPVAAILALIVLLLATGNLFQASANRLTLFSAIVWAFAGPHLVVASGVAVILITPLALRRRWAIPRVVAALAVLSLIFSCTITSSILLAAFRNGGTVDPVRAFALETTPARPARTAVYAVANGQQLEARIYEPHGAVAGAPVLLYIHGGGWIGGSAHDNASQNQWFADQGWFVVSVDYRLATGDNATWDQAPADVACALTWAAQQARAAGADADRVTVLGDSSGGNLAINLGWSAAQSRAVSTCPGLGAVPIPRAVVATVPVADPGYTYEHGRKFIDAGPQGFTEMYLGGTPAEYPNRLQALSAATYISAQAPATLILQAERDDFIPAQGSYVLAATAQAGGVNVTLVRIPFTYHGFDAVSNSLGWQLKLTVTAQWLQDQGLAPVR